MSNEKTHRQITVADIKRQKRVVVPAVDRSSWGQAVKQNVKTLRFTTTTTK